MIPANRAGETDQEDRDEVTWLTFAASQDQAWVASMAERLEAGNYSELASGVIEEEMERAIACT